jgi:uncharacterized SAM-binding protein YcdF (DUF218 family)
MRRIKRPETGWTFQRVTTHPGEVLLEEFLKPLRLARYFGTSPEFWLNLQQSFDLTKARLSRRQRLHERSGLMLLTAVNALVRFDFATIEAERPGRLAKINSSMVPTTRQDRLRIARTLGIVLVTAIACVVILYFSIPMSDTQQHQFDVIVVLGNPANADGSIAPMARSRVEEAIRQYHAGVAPRLIMTGGAVKNRFVEAQVMAQFARSEGVPDDAVFAEGEARNTIQNAYYSYKIMQAHGWSSALVVSTPTHLRRASLIFSHYPLAWEMHAAPWPPNFPLWNVVWLWCSEAGYTSYGRLFGFPNAGKYLPQTRFKLPGF